MDNPIILTEHKKRNTEETHFWDMPEFIWGLRRSQGSDYIFFYYVYRIIMTHNLQTLSGEWKELHLSVLFRAYLIVWLHLCGCKESIWVIVHTFLRLCICTVNNNNNGAAFVTSSTQTWPIILPSSVYLQVQYTSSYIF